MGGSGISAAVIGAIVAMAAAGATPYKSITWERLQRSGPDLKVIGRLAVRSSSEIKSSRWSVGCETLDRDYGDFEAYRQFVGQLGVKYARLQSGWAKCERQRGVYSFEWLDKCVNGLVEQGVEPWMCLCYGNPIYGSQKGLGSAIFTSEEALTAWCRYVEAVVGRYKGVVRRWEVWNEPMGSSPPEAYAELLIRSVESIKKVQDDATIMAFSVHGFSPKTVLNFPRRVFDILKQRGRADIVDYVTYHPYTRNPDDCYPMVEDLRRLVVSYAPKARLYQGECGCPSILEWGHALSNYPWTEYSQAKWVLRRMAGDAARGIGSSVFTMVDLRYPTMLQSFGLLRADLQHRIIYRRPVFYGVQHMASFFDDTVAPTGMLRYESNCDREMTVAGFERGDDKAILVWFKDRIPSDDLQWQPVDLRIEGCSFKEPVYVEMITGKVYEIDRGSWAHDGDAVKFKGLPIWDSPVMIAERSMVSLRAN